MTGHGVSVGWVVFGVLLGMGLGSVGAWWWGRRALLRQGQRVQAVLQRALQGDTQARLEAGSAGLLTAGLNQMLSERTHWLSQGQHDSEALNQSVVRIMQAVGEIATSKDLSRRVPVTEDVTGAIADALNLLNEETARVLGEVALVSKQVAHATVAVKTQSDLASQAAGREQREVELAARELGQAADALSSIAARARASNEAAEHAVRANATADQCFDETHLSITQSRLDIMQTEQRVKRLGERSLEIGQVVAVMQQLAQRTGVLALNASLHAVAVGQAAEAVGSSGAAHGESVSESVDASEAARRFAKVAQEVRRLSDNAREAAQSAGELVQAVRIDIQATAQAMQLLSERSELITQMSQRAHGAMAQARNSTEQLAGSVRDIARSSHEQAKVGAGLQERARIIQEASEETTRQLQAQALETRRLVEYAKALLDEVSVFRLPAASERSDRP